MRHPKRPVSLKIGPETKSKSKSKSPPEPCPHPPPPPYPPPRRRGLRAVYVLRDVFIALVVCVLGG